MGTQASFARWLAATNYAHAVGIAQARLSSCWICFEVTFAVFKLVLSWEING